MNDDAPRTLSPHRIGEPLDRLSISEFDARIAMLREEITRLEAARDRKRQHLDEAGSIFSPKSQRDS